MRARNVKSCENRCYARSNIRSHGAGGRTPGGRRHPLTLPRFLYIRREVRVNQICEHPNQLTQRLACFSDWPIQTEPGPTIFGVSQYTGVSVDVRYLLAWKFLLQHCQRSRNGSRRLSHVGLSVGSGTASHERTGKRSKIVISSRPWFIPLYCDFIL
jgi:hypothetical protein